MPTEHSFIDIYSTLSCVSFLLSIVELCLSTLNKPISDLIWTCFLGSKCNLNAFAVGALPRTELRDTTTLSQNPSLAIFEGAANGREGRGEENTHRTLFTIKW